MFKKPSNAAMTDSQWRLFWILWKAACEAQGWTKEKGYNGPAVDQQRYAVLNGLGFSSLLRVDPRGGFDRLKAELERLAGQVRGAAEQAAAASGRDMGQERRLRYVLARELLPAVAAYFGDPRAYVGQIVADKFARDLGHVPAISELTDEPTFVTRGTRSGESRVIEQPSRLEQLVLTLRERVRGEARDVGHSPAELSRQTDAKYHARRAYFHDLAGCADDHEAGRHTQSVARAVPAVTVVSPTALAAVEAGAMPGRASVWGDPYAGAGVYKGD